MLLTIITTGILENFEDPEGIIDIVATTLGTKQLTKRMNEKFQQRLKDSKKKVLNGH